MQKRDRTFRKIYPQIEIDIERLDLTRKITELQKLSWKISNLNNNY